MAEIDSNLYLYKIPTNEILGNRKEFYRLKREYDGTIQGWLGRVQDKIDCCEFPEIVSSEFHLVDKFMCELNAEEIESIRSAGDIWSFEKLKECFAIREIDADQSNDDNTVTSIDMKCEWDDFDEYPPNDNNDMNSGMINDYLDGIKSETTDEMDSSSVNLPIDVANGNMNTQTEESDSNAVAEMLIEGMQCEPEEYKFSVCDPVHEFDDGNKQSNGPVEMKPNENKQIKRARVHTCSICEKFFTQLGHLKQHKQSVHEGIRRFNCDLCKKSFFLSSDLNRHKQSIHEGLRPFSCNFYKRSFTHFGHLNEYWQSYYQPRYKCADCSKSYSTHSGLTKHMQFYCTASPNNQAPKSFKCQFCDKTYTSLGALKMHIRTHTKPCKCHLCGKAFSRPWILQGHIRTHTGDKPFSCNYCHRAFADKSNLRAHLQTHSDGKKYSCTTCSKTFSRMRLLTKHTESGCPGLLEHQSHH